MRSRKRPTMADRRVLLGALALAVSVFVGCSPKPIGTPVVQSSQVAAAPTPSPTSSPSARAPRPSATAAVPSASAEASPASSPTATGPLPMPPPFPDGAISTTKAKKSVGKVKTVCGQVASAVYAKTSRGSPTFLNLDRSSKRFAIVIWKEYRSLFDKAPEKLFKDEWVCIQGKITTFRGVPQIVSLGGDVAHPSRFIPLTGEAGKCLAKGVSMSIYCTIQIGRAHV